MGKDDKEKGKGKGRIEETGIGIRRELEGKKGNLWKLIKMRTVHTLKK